MPRTLALVVLSCVASGVASGARAQQRPPAHLGVQLRTGSGVLYVHAAQDLGGGHTETISGAALTTSFALGTMLDEQLSLSLDVLLAHAPSASRGVLPETTFSALQVGASLTYWLMPANVFLAAALGAVRSSVESSPVNFAGGLEIPSEEVSNVGLGLHLGAGKQFWLDARWGLGVSALLWLAGADNEIAGNTSARVLLCAGALATLTFH